MADRNKRVSEEAGSNLETTFTRWEKYTHIPIYKTALYIIAPRDLTAFVHLTLYIPTKRNVKAACESDFQCKLKYAEWAINRH